MSIKQFQQEVSRGFPSPAYLLHSPDDFLLYEALSEIKEKYQTDAFNFHVFDAKSSDDIRPMEHIVDILNTLPFPSGRKIVVIENAQKLPRKEANKLEEYLLNPCASSLMVMLYEGTSPKLFEASDIRTIKFIALKVEEKDVPFWIKGVSKRKGVEFTDGAIEYLISCVGTDLGMLSAEIEKFSLWKSSRIEADDVKGMVYAGAEYSAFDLINALKVKDTTEVFRIFGKINENMEPQVLMGALNWHYSNLWVKWGRKDERFFHEIFILLHEADASIKTSHKCVMDDLLVNLLSHQLTVHGS